MSPIDEDELRRLLRSVEPLDTTDVAAVAMQQAGSQRRRRGLTALLALVLSLALLAGALVAVRALREARPEDRDPLGSPTPHPLPAVTTAQLPTEKDLAPINTFNFPLRPQVDLPAGTWAGSPTLCQPHPDLRESSLQVREFTDARVTAAVLGFQDVAQATAARQKILGWYRNCAPHEGKVDEWTGARLAVKPRGVEPVVAVAANPYWEPSETAQGRHEEAVVVQAGNRIAWVAQAHGEEQNCGLEASTEIGACGPFASAQAIADRLAS